MRRLGSSRSVVLLVAALAASGPACSGGSGDVKAVVGTAGADLPEAMVERTWPVELATSAAQDALLAGNDGWVTLVMNRNYKHAVKQLGTSGGLPAARAHAEIAGLYRNAALVSANSLIETYGETPQETDPLGTAHLLAVSYALNGDLAKAREQSQRLDAETADPVLAWHAPWKAWLASDSPTWPPDLASLPVDLGPPTVGAWAEGPPMPHYTLPERGGSTSTLDMADPAVLVALALWHDAAAREAAGEEAAMVDTYVARYRMPIEGGVVGVALPLEFRFGADYLVAEDGPFLADLLGEAGAAAVDAHKDKSLLAALADRARVDGKVSAERGIDLAAGLRSQLLAAQQRKVEVEDSAHRTFADIAEVGVLRGLALVAEEEGDREASGILRIAAMEKSDDATACPTGLLSLAAWDAANRYPARGADMLNNMIKRYPSLEAARYGLDVLALRVSRERAKLPPGM